MIQGLDKRLLTSRGNSNLSRKQVAERIGVTESLIGLYESGSRQPSLTTLIKLSALYKVTTDYLLGCEPTPSNTISLTGLTYKQAQAITLTVECFRNNTL